ncbi:MAG: hypothetical protein GF353_14470 [Candidatus Lokiarchaeota archaeon]|nr:hypothetical protein [Candidatus Lokiarchaeota archaeon]
MITSPITIFIIFLAVIAFYKGYKEFLKYRKTKIYLQTEIKKNENLDLFIENVYFKKIELKGLAAELINEAIYSPNLDSLLSSQAGKLESYLKFPRLISSLLILFGLFGTIVGLLESIGGLDTISVANLSSNLINVGISHVFGGLNKAFETTLWGIIGTIFLSFSLYGFSKEGNKLWDLYSQVANKIFIYKQTHINLPSEKEFYKIVASMKRIEFEMDSNLKESFSKFLELQEISSDQYHKLINRFHEIIDNQKMTSEENYNLIKSIDSVTKRYKDTSIHYNELLNERFSVLINSLNDLNKNTDSVKNLLNIFQNEIKNERLSIDNNDAYVTLATPDYFSKGKWSRIYIYVYTKKLLNKIKKRIEALKDDYKAVANEKTAKNIWDRRIIVKVVPEDVFIMDTQHIIRLTYPLSELKISLKPNDNIKITNPVPASLILIDMDLNEEIITVPFNAIIKDYIVDHVSRPLVHNITSISSFLIGSGVIILQSLTKIGLNSFVSLPLGTTLIVLSAILAIIKNRKFDKPLKSFVSP